MSISPFHAYFKSRELSCLSYDKDRLLAAYTSSDMEVFPYQVAAAQFALRSPYLRGADFPPIGMRQGSLQPAEKRLRARFPQAYLHFQRALDIDIMEIVACSKHSWMPIILTISIPHSKSK